MRLEGTRKASALLQSSLLSVDGDRLVLDLYLVVLCNQVAKRRLGTQCFHSQACRCIALVQFHGRNIHLLLLARGLDGSGQLFAYFEVF